MTKEDVADYLDCSVSIYSRYENGTKEPSVDILVKLSELYDVSVDYLLGLSTRGISVLTSYEQTLIEAARNADERAREDALNLLKLRQ